MFRGFDDDPFFRGHLDGIQQMHASMNQMFGGMMGGGFGIPPAAITGREYDRGHHRAGVRDQQVAAYDPFNPGSMFGHFNSMMGNMHRMMGGMEQDMARQASDPNAHFYSSSTVMSYSNTGEGQPRIYQASNSTRQAPGGVKETRRAVRDSEAGVAKMAIGHHLGDRAHVVEREENLRTKEQEEKQDFINLDEGEAETFNREWRERTRTYNRGGGSLAGPNRYSTHQHHHHHHPYSIPPSVHHRQQPPQPHGHHRHLQQPALTYHTDYK